MYTLSDIYTRLTTNATSTEGDHSFSPPASPASSMYTLTQIYEAIPTIVANTVKLGTSYLGVSGTFKSLLPDTGQTGCWDATGTAITCGTAPVGQDAEYTASNSGTLNPSFTDNGNETITDNNTNLMWQKCSRGLSGAGCATGTVVTNYWADALSYCEGLNFAGQTDWRLPNVKELQSIVNYQNYSPAIDTTYFPATQSAYYWSGTTYGDNPASAWYVNFYDGYVSDGDKDTSLLYVRCVRQ